MKEILLEYAKRGAMTKEELADVLKIKPEAVRRMAKDGRLPRIQGMTFVRFDPIALIRVLCDTPKAEPAARSLTIERHKTGEPPIGGFRKCLL